MVILLTAFVASAFQEDRASEPSFRGGGTNSPPARTPTSFPTAAPTKEPDYIRRVCSHVTCQFDNYNEDRMSVHHHKKDKHGHRHECGHVAFEPGDDKKQKPKCLCECVYARQELRI